jgi:mycofactocin precursor
MSADNPGTEATARATTEATARVTTEVITEAQDPEEAEELLVEEISIDGMCGVY